MPLRVLVVDDYHDAADSLRVLLQLWGHEVRVARDGHAALAVATDFQPQVVLLDVQMPGLHGGEVARRLRLLPGAERVLLIATTGMDPDEERLAPYAALFDGHLTKPFNLERLERLLGTSAHSLNR